jgi:hypothetical protein
MRIIPNTPEPPKRQNITIEFTPEEQDQIRARIGGLALPTKAVSDLYCLLGKAELQ